MVSSTFSQDHLKEYAAIQSNITKQSLTRLKSLKKQIKSSDIKNTIQLYQAIQSFYQKDYDQAYGILKKISKKFVLKEYAQYYLCLTLLHQNKYHRALKELPSIKNPKRNIEWDIFWLQAELLARTQQHEGLQDMLVAIQKDSAKDHFKRIKSAYFSGLADLLSDDPKTAYEHFISIITQFPGTEFDQKVFDHLASEAMDLDDLLDRSQWNMRAHNLIQSGRADEAIKIFTKFVKSDPSYHEKIAFATFKARDYKKAAALYEQLLTSKHFKSPESDILDKLATSYSRVDDFDNAIKTHQKLIEKFPNTKTAKTSEYKLGFLYFDSGQYKKTIEYFGKFLNKATPWRQNKALWYRFWSFYLTQQFEDARQEIETLISKTKDKDMLSTLNYWKARTLTKLNKRKQAIKTYSNLSHADPFDFYTLLAKQRLAPGKLETPFLISSHKMGFLPNGQVLPYEYQPNLKPLAKDDPLIKAILLSHIGHENNAFNESMQSSHASTVPHYNTVKAFELSQNYFRGYALRKEATTGKMMGANRLEGYRLGFPKAYEKYVKPYAKHWGIKQNLVYAIMRQESAFKPQALSSASANGLMQIIPQTGMEIAAKIGFENFDVSMLTKPDISIFFGSYYLRELLQTFNNELVYTIAAYNAGPEALKRWTKKWQHLEPDVFIELIPYAETKKYVKKVLVNLLVYQRIY